MLLAYGELTELERHRIKTEFHMLSELQHENIIGHFGGVHIRGEGRFYLYVISFLRILSRVSMANFANFIRHGYIEKNSTKELSEYITLNREEGTVVAEQTIWEILAQVMESLYYCHFGKNAAATTLWFEQGIPVRPSMPPGRMTVLHRDICPDHSKYSFSVCALPVAIRGV